MSREDACQGTGVYGMRADRRDRGAFWGIVEKILSNLPSRNDMLQQRTAQDHPYPGL
jgi:hypothetical protein